MMGMGGEPGPSLVRTGAPTCAGERAPACAGTGARVHGAPVARPDPRPPSARRPPRRKGSKVPGGRILPTSYGTFMAYSYSGGKRERRCFASFLAAQEWLSRLRNRDPSELPPLTPAQYLDAQLAIARLPAGRTLVDAAAMLSESDAGVGAESTPFRVALEGFLSERGVSASAETVSRYRLFCGRLCSLVGGDTPISAVRPGDVSELVSGLSPGYRNNVLRHISPLFSWAESRGMVQSNPVKRVERARRVAPPLGILTVEEARRVMRVAASGHPALVPYLAVGLFAGVRPAEMRRMGVDSFRNGYIVLTASQTKTADARTISIRPNLAAWLAAYPPGKYPLSKVSVKALTRFRRACAGVKWTHDCMRHSFATYAYELTHDAVAVSAEMGHAGTAVFFKHYRALAAPGDGELYFGIFPE